MVRLKVGEHICNDRYKPDESSQVNAAPFSYYSKQPLRESSFRNFTKNFKSNSLLGGVNSNIESIRTEYFTEHIYSYINIIHSFFYKNSFIRTRASYVIFIKS